MLIIMIILERRLYSKQVLFSIKTTLSYTETPLKFTNNLLYSSNLILYNNIYYTKPLLYTNTLMATIAAWLINKTKWKWMPISYQEH